MFPITKIPKDQFLGLDFSYNKTTLVNTSALIVTIMVIIDNADGIVTNPNSINHKSFKTWS